MLDLMAASGEITKSEALAFGAVMAVLGIALGGVLGGLLGLYTGRRNGRRKR